MPDLNSLPPSPFRSQAPTTPRRPSQTRRLSERAALAALNSTPPPRSPKPQDEDVDPGPGPIRHPRPLTAAELYLAQETENEAVVNRLTRELALLREQTASRASNTSSLSVSTGIADSTTQTENVYLNSSIPISARRHRSSSNLSSRGAASVSSNAATAGSTSTVNTSAGLAGSGIAPPRDASYSHSRSGGDPLSRQSSVASRRSEASSPSAASSFLQAGSDGYPLPSSSHHRHSHSNSLSGPPSARAPNYVPSTHRYDETTQAKAELEMMKNENEALKARIRELEQMVRRNNGGSSSSTIAAPPTTSEQHPASEGRATASTGTGEGA